MPSKLPQFVIRTEKENIDKIAYIAKKEDRSTTAEIVHLIKKRIDAYESIHGVIKIDDLNEK